VGLSGQYIAFPLKMQGKASDMTNKTLKTARRPLRARAPESPAKALERPSELKNWSSDLIGILKGQESTLFDSHDFRPGDITKADFSRILRKMTGCGSVVELRSKMDYGTGEVSDPKLHAANFCGQHTICPYCAARMQDRRKAKFKDHIKSAARTYRHAYLVTATIPPVPSWREDLNILLDSWKSFRKMGQVRKGRAQVRSAGEWGKIKAGISKVELKRGAGSELPHCHIHALFFTNEYFDFRVWNPEEKAKPRAERESLYSNNGSKISREWNLATDGRATGINVKKISFKAPKRAKTESLNDFRSRAENWSLADSIYDQSREVLKYATKFESAPEKGTEKLFAKDFLDIKSVTYGRRLFQTYGAFYGLGDGNLLGSEFPLSEKPIIYEARWRTDRYSPLMVRSTAVFPNSDPSPGLSARLKVLNRIQGATRRIRSAINNAKRDYFSFGLIAPIPFAVREYLEDGGYNETITYLEPPAAVVSAPHEIDNWEKWVDDSTANGRAAYNSAREDLDADSHERIIGTPEERAGRARIELQARLNSPSHDRQVINSFLEVIAGSSGP
jgi:hypothetical protein